MFKGGRIPPGLMLPGLVNRAALKVAIDVEAALRRTRMVVPDDATLAVIYDRARSRSVTTPTRLSLAELIDEERVRWLAAAYPPN